MTVSPKSELREKLWFANIVWRVQSPWSFFTQRIWSIREVHCRELFGWNRNELSWSHVKKKQQKTCLVKPPVLRKAVYRFQGQISNGIGSASLERKCVLFLMEIQGLIRINMGKKRWLQHKIGNFDNMSINL